jgi:hypothetical protein
MFGNENVTKTVEANMGRALRPGEEVSWNTGQGTTHGREVKKPARPIQDHPIPDHKGTASNPEYVAQSGKRAAHKRSTLKKT